MSIFIIGAGMGDNDTMTRGALKKIEEADLIIGAKRITEPFLSVDKKVIFEYDADRVEELLKNGGYNNAAVIFSGDISFYSGAKRLIERFPEAKLYAGISCVAYFCAKIGMSYDDMNIISTHGRKCNIVSEVRTHKKTFVLLGENPCKKLTEYGLGNVKVHIGERLSYSDEKITSGLARDFSGADIDKLSVIVIENEDYNNSLQIGINDEKFIRGDAPMTKSEVRCVSISRLGIKADDICWDIGAGTGSVTVEMALLCGRGMVYAVEKNPSAAELIHSNCKKFMTDNVTVIEDTAPECLDGLEAPDKVFIGGSSGNVRKIIEAALAKNKSAQFVINAISLETLTETLEAVKALNMEYEISQISVSRGNVIGKYNMMKGLNPVYIISAKRR